MITHGIEEIAQVADRILVIEDGRIGGLQMKTISRIAYNVTKNKTRSILIMMSICLTTMLLVIISTVGNGMIRLRKVGQQLIWKQLWPVYRRRWYAIKRSGTQS